LISWLSICASGQTTLFVFAPGKQNIETTQAAFDGLFGAKKSIVFNKIKDLDSALAVLADAPVIAPEPFFILTPGYKMVLSGKVGADSSEKYLIVTAKKEITMQNIAMKKVGIVDFLGKDRLPIFIKDYFNLEIKFMKRANKDDDLLTMLGMETVDAIIVSASQYKEILSNTKLPLVVLSSSSKEIRFLTYGVRELKEDEKQKKMLSNAPVKLLKEIGIDGWGAY
jgi:hypothetical protein